MQNDTTKLIKEAKKRYYTDLDEKLSDPKIGHKHFWTAYKKIANKKKNTNIPPIIDNDIYFSNSEKKANVFNGYFANQCTLNDNGSVLPNLILRTESSLSNICVSKNQIVSIIKNLNSKKAHGCDGISVSMLQICADEVSTPLQIIFNDCCKNGMCPESWKYANVQPIHRKNNCQIISNYRPISLLPICSNVLEKIVFDQLYTFLNVNNLLSRKQSGFCPGDSTIFQLLSITSTIYESFERYD